MDHELFAVKLCQLEEQYRDMRSKIYLMQQDDHEVIKQELKKMEEAYDKTMQLLRENTRGCRSPAVKALNEAQIVYDSKIKEIMQKDMPHYIRGEDRQEAKAEGRALYAEYSIDFAIQAVQSALMAVLSALDEQMNLEEWRNEDE